MDVTLSFAFFYLALISTSLSLNVGAAAEKQLGSEALSILLLDSADSSYNSSSRILREWVADTLRTASESASYQLQLISIDTQCDQEVALSGFLGQVHSNVVEEGLSGEAPGTTLVAVLGGGCVTDSELIADTIAAGERKTPLISYNPFLYSSTTAIPSGGIFHFQMYPSLRGVVTTLVATIQQYGWKQMSIISEFNYPFLQMELDVVTALNEANITVLQPSHIRKEDNAADVPYLFAKYARIFFLNTYENKAAEILCHAFQEGRYYPDYVWILYGWYSNNWWTRTPTSCNSSQLLTALERAIILQSYPNSIADETGGYLYPYIPPLLNDSVQLVIEAVNKTSELCSKTSDSLNGSLVETCNGTANFGNLVSSFLLEASFEGKSGTVEFDASGNRAYSQVELFQFRNGSDATCFAYVQLDSGELYYKQNENNDSVWPGAGIPQDGSPVDVVSTFYLVVVILNYSFGFLGIIFTLVCLGFNILFRKRKLVKLTSPNLNYFIILGALFLYLGAIVRATPSTSLAVWVHVCRVLTPFLCIGYSIFFGTILAKMWRIYYIFHNPTTKKKEVKDWHLAVLVTVILTIDLLIVAPGFIIPETRPMPFLITDRERQPGENEKGIIENYFVITCHTTYSIYWRLCIYLYMGILQTIGLLLAIRTRKVKIKGLNDSKEIMTIIYITTIVDIELILVTILLKNYSNIRVLFFTGGIIFATTMSVGLVFIPKMWGLYRDPQGKYIFGKDTHHSTQGTERLASQVDKSRVISLEKEVQSLQTQLKHQQTAMQDHGLQSEKTVNGIGDPAV